MDTVYSLMFSGCHCLFLGDVRMDAVSSSLNHIVEVKGETCTSGLGMKNCIFFQLANLTTAMIRWR